MAFIAIEKEWTTVFGHKAMVVMTTFGTRNGYIQYKLPELLGYYVYQIDINDYGKWSQELIDIQSKVNDINIHGGLTFYGKLQDTNNHWIGFDCGHAWDAPDWEAADKLFGLSPDYLKFRESRQSFHIAPDQQIRSLEYVMQQCELLSEQIHEIFNTGGII